MKSSCARWDGADCFGFSGAGDVEVRSGVEGHLVEDVIFLLPVKKVGGRDGEGCYSGEAGLGRGVPYLHDAVGIAKRKRLEQDFVNDAEDGGVGPDAEGHDDGRHQGKARVFHEQPKSESKVLQEC